MVKLFDIGGLLSKKNLIAWLSLLLLLSIPIFLELYFLLTLWSDLWPLYLIVNIAFMLLGTLLSARLLYLRLDKARQAYQQEALTRLLGTYLLPLILLNPGIISSLVGFLLAIPKITDKLGLVFFRIIAMAPQQWHNSIVLVHAREQQFKKSGASLVTEHTQ